MDFPFQYLLIFYGKAIIHELWNLEDVYVSLLENGDAWWRHFIYQPCGPNWHDLCVVAGQR